MKKNTIITSIFFAAAFSAIAQNRTSDMEISLPEQRIPKSNYNSISFIDTRYDTSHFGIVQLGAFNSKARVKPKTPIGVQLTNVLNALVDSDAREGELLFQLRQFSYAEVTGATSEKGYCYIRAVLYAKKNDRFYKLGGIDSVIFIKGMDVTRPLFRNSSRLISNFLASHVTIVPEESHSLSFDDIIHLDQLEKQSIPVYVTTGYKDGLYETYQSFMQQVPDKAIVVNMKKEKIDDVRISGANGTTEKVKMKNIYAIVYNGQPFIATEYGYYPLQKSNNDFFFTGKAKATADAGGVVAASVFFGIVGGLIASDATSIFEMKIDHINGGFMRIREIK